tara:strand:- start:440 stop:610 length:171 start_codon:yes stop_codon:yes gene_type:complete
MSKIISPPLIVKVGVPSGHYTRLERSKICSEFLPIPLAFLSKKPLPHGSPNVAQLI